MRQRARWFEIPCLAIILTVLSLAMVAPAQGASDVAVSAVVEKLLAGEEENGFSGVIILARAGKPFYTRACGVIDTSAVRPTTLETRYYIASISKQFTAAGILKLQEQGKLQVSDPIGKYIPDGATEDKRAITIHQLLTHRSGLTQKYAADGITDREAATRALLAQPLEVAPGSTFQYANDNYNLLAILTEIVAGKPFEEHLEQEILRPAGLSQTGFWGMTREVDATNFAEMLTPAHDSVMTANWGFRGATGMYSTASDLLRWQQALFAGKVVAPSSVDAILAAHSKLPNGLEVGYGWYRSKSPGGRDVRWTRGSESFGHSAIIKVYTDNRTLVVLSSSGESSGKIAASRHIAEGIEAILDPKP